MLLSLSLSLGNYSEFSYEVIVQLLRVVCLKLTSVKTSCKSYYKLSDRANSCALVSQVTVRGNSNCSRQLVELVSAL